MEYDTFIANWLGKAIDWDGYFGPQCVDLVAQYCADNGKPVAWANAKDWANNPALSGAFDWTDNNPADPNQYPNRGDIVVFNGNLPGSGGYGHICIFDMKVSTGVWQGLDQNWGGQYVHFIPNHNWSYVMGWWTVKPKPVPAPVETPPPSVPIPAPLPQPDPAPANPTPPTPPIVPTPVVPTPTPIKPPVIKKPIWWTAMLAWLRRHNMKVVKK